MRNKIFISASLLLLMWGAIVNSLNGIALAENTPTIAVNSYAAVSIGETVPIKAYVVFVSNLTGYQFQLRFNATMLQCLSASTGTWFPGPPNSSSTIAIDNNQGTVSIQAYLQGNTAPLSTIGGQIGTLLSVSFNATYGTPWGPWPREVCTLAITDDALYGIGNQTIQHAVWNGSYTAPYAPPHLDLTLNTNGKYRFEDLIDINGTLDGNGYVIPGALVALEADDRTGNPIVARTLQASSAPASCPLQITALTPCDMGGYPQDSFAMGSFMYFKVVVGNVGSSDLIGLVLVNAYDSSNASIGVSYFGSYVPAGNSTSLILGMPLNYDPYPLILTPATSGRATVYASVWTDFVGNGGTPLSPESQATFNITGTSQGKGASMNPPSEGTYQTMLRVHYRTKTYSSTNPPNYTISAGAECNGSKVTTSKQIQISIAGDMNIDGKADLLDLVILAQAYLSLPGEPRWDQRADVNGDGKADLLDLVLLAQNYLKGTV